MILQKMSERLSLLHRRARWPLPMMILFFVLLEALFILVKSAVNSLVYAPDMYHWAMETFGMTQGDQMLTLVSILASTAVCAWHIGLQRYVTFSRHTARRWSILPITLGYAALSIVSWLLGPLLVRMELPLPTENLLVYTVAYSILYTAIVTVFCAVIYAFRFSTKKNALLLMTADAALVLLLMLNTACSGQVQQSMLDAAYANPAAHQVTVTTIGIPENEDSEGLLNAVLSHSGLSTEEVVIVPAEEALSTLRNNPFTDYEEAMAPSNLLGDILLWIQLIPVFFAMKRWLFPLNDIPKEAAACDSASSCGG